jgi:peptide/nickel transport system permease protein
MGSANVVNSIAIVTKPQEESRFLTIWNAFYGNRVAFVSMIVLAVIVLSCLLAPVIAPYDPLQGKVSERLLPIGSAGHFLGTDEQGRDLWTRILYGGRVSLFTGVMPVLIAACIGGFLGVVAGYFGGILNMLIMRTLDIFYSFPVVLLAIGISAALGQGITNIIISITIVFIPPIARIAESAVKAVKEEEFIEAARSSGAGALSIILYHVLSNIVSKVFVYSTTQISISLVLASGLSFLGLGISPPTPEWGIMLNSLKQQMFIDPIVTVIPGAFIFMTALSVNLTADGLRDAWETK